MSKNLFLLLLAEAILKNFRVVHKRRMHKIAKKLTPLPPFLKNVRFGQPPALSADVFYGQTTPYHPGCIP